MRPTDESTLGLLRFSHFQFLLSGLSIHCTCSLHMVLLAQPILRIKTRKIMDR